jgi:hypothetical protein
MPHQDFDPIRLGAYANDGTGDDLRTAFQRVNANFQTLFDDLTVTGAANIGTGTGLYSGNVNTALQIKSLKGGGGITINSDATSVTITGLANVQGDTSPTLAGNLNLNGNNIFGVGDVQASVWGIDIRTINLLAYFTTTGDLDLGTFTAPAAGEVDLGLF